MKSNKNVKIRLQKETKTNNNHHQYSKNIRKLIHKLIQIPNVYL